MKVTICGPDTYNVDESTCPLGFHQTLQNTCRQCPSGFCTPTFDSNERCQCARDITQANRVLIALWESTSQQYAEGPRRDPCLTCLAAVPAVEQHHQRDVLGVPLQHLPGVWSVQPHNQPRLDRRLPVLF